MKKSVRNILIAVFGLAVLVLIALLAGPLLLNTELFKQRLDTALEDVVGRPVTISGDLHLRLLPWPGFSVSGISVSGGPGFERAPLFTVENVSGRIALTPLLDKRLELSSLYVDGARLSLVRAEPGKNNWQGLFGSGGKAPEPGDSSQGAAADGSDEIAVPWSVGVENIHVRDAAVSWIPDALSTPFLASDVDFTSLEDGSFSLELRLDDIPGAPHELALKAGLSGTGVGDIIMGLGSKAKARFKASILDKELGEDGENGHPNGEVDAELLFDLADGSLDAPNFSIHLQGFEATGGVTGETLFSEPKVRGEIKGSDPSLAATLAALRLRAKPLEAEKGRTRTEFSASLEFARNILSLEIPLLKVDKTDVSGSLKFVTNGEGGSEIRMSSKLLDLEDLLSVMPVVPDEVKEVKAAKAAQSEQLREPAFGKLLDTRLELDLKADELLAFDIKADHAAVQLSIKDGVVRARKIGADLARGRMVGDITADISETDISVDGRLEIFGLKEGVVLESLGQGEITETVFAHGLTLRGAKDNYQGNLRLEPFNPRDLFWTLGLSLDLPPGADMFTRASLTALIDGKPGTISMSNIDMMLDDTHITGGGRVIDGPETAYQFDLSAETIDLGRYMNAMAIQTGAEAAQGGNPPAQAATPAAQTEAPPERTALSEEHLRILERRRFLAQHLSLNLVRGMNMDGTLAIKTLRLSRSEARQAVLKLAGHNNRLDVRLESPDVLGGKATASMILSAPSLELEASTSLEADSLSMPRVLELLELDEPVEGALSGSVELRASGATPGEIVKASNMTADLKLADLVLGQGAESMKFNAVSLKAEVEAGGVSDWPDADQPPGNPHLAKLSLKIDPFEKGPGAELSLSGQAWLSDDLDALVVRDAKLDGAVSLERPERETLEFHASLDADTREMLATAGDLTIRGMGLTAMGKLETARKDGVPVLLGEVKVNPFDPKKLLDRLDIPLAPRRDEKALTHAAASFTLEASKGHAEVRDLSLALDDTQVTGSLAWEPTSTPAWTISLSGNEFDYDRYREKEVEGANEPDEPVEIPLAFLDSLDLGGDVSLGKLRLYSLQFNEIKGHVRAVNGVLDAKPLGARFYGGKLTGQYSAQTLAHTMLSDCRAEVKGFESGGLMADVAGWDLLKGKGDINGRLRMSGADNVELVRNMNGAASLEIRDGSLLFDSKEAVETLDIPEDKLKDAESAVASPTRRPFKRLSATFSVESGVIRNDDLKLVGSQGLSVTGGGWVDLDKETVDYQINALFLATAEIPISFTGSFDNVQIHYRPLSAIGKTTGNIVGGIVTLPFKILKGIFD